MPREKELNANLVPVTMLLRKGLRNAPNANAMQAMR